MKKIVILSVVLFTWLSCKQNMQSDIKEVTITIKVDEGIVLKDEKPIKAKSGVLWKEIESIAASKIEIKKENNKDYDFFDWKLNDENGKLLLEDTPINEDVIVFARTNYTKFMIEGTTIIGYTGEKPKGRIIIPKEITRIGNKDYVFPFRDCKKLTNVNLELCKEITHLALSHTGIKSIDPSHNPKLTELYLYDTEISSIDISNNPELTRLDLDNTKINSIDPTHNPKLSVLNLNNTKMTSIDLSNNPELSVLNLNNTKMINIDLCHNPKLTELYLYRTDIINIDVSYNPELTELELGYTKIASIDLQHNPKLTNLQLNNTKIRDIDVSNNPKLTKLNLYNTKIKSIDLSNNPSINDISFEDCSLLKEVDLSTCSRLWSFSFSGAINAVVTLPSSIKEIKKGAFGDEKANYCKKVIVPNNEIKQLVKTSGYPEERIEVKP